MRVSKNKYLWLILSLAGIVFCDISLLNHYLFRSNAWDLGIFNKAIYDYAHLHWNISMVRMGSGPDMFPKNLLGDHFEIYLILFSPLYYLFGSYTLLLVQIAAILLGGYGVYKFIQYKTGDTGFARLALIHFLCVWGIYSALAFDYHNNVVAAMGIPWLLLYFEKKEFRKAALVFFLISIGKENMALWLGFIGLALALWNLKDKSKRWAGFIFSVSGFVLFIILIQFVIPAFSGKGHQYAYNSFHSIGSSYAEIMKTIFTRPWVPLKMLFVNPLSESGGDGVKLALHIAIILSGGWAFYYNPRYLFMLIPIYGQKLFYDDVARWGLYLHYSIEFVPILSIALFLTLHKLFSHTRQLNFNAIASILLTCAVSITVMENSVLKTTCCFYRPEHYIVPFSRQKAKAALDMIPKNASVSAMCTMVPHMAFRDTIYQYPYGTESEYIILADLGEPPFRLYPADIERLRQTYSDRKKFTVILDKDNILIVKRIQQGNKINP